MTNRRHSDPLINRRPPGRDKALAALACCGTHEDAMPEPLADQPPATARSGRVSIITPTGARRLLAVDPLAQSMLWATLLLGSEAGVVELAPGRRDSLGRLRVSRRRDPRAYPRAADPRDVAERAIALAAEGHEVFCGPLARAAALPGSGGVTGGRVVWVDLDDREGFARLAAFTPAPCLIVASGGSGGAHAYWRLARRLSGRVIEAANRRLAERLEGDRAVCDRGRLMRLPGTINGKTGDACRLVLADLRPARLDPDALLGPGFTAVAQRPRLPKAPMIGARLDPLRDLDPPSYFAALCGAEPDEDGLVSCPLPDHEDRTPSCRVYATAERGWWCFGCARGGRMYDLASLLIGGPWGRELRGEPFRRARSFACERLGVRATV